MKNTLKICLLILGFVLTTSVVNAQSNAKEQAMSQTKALQEETEFSMSKFKEVYAVYLKYDRKLEGINKHIDASTINHMEATAKLEKVFAKEMKAVLSAEEYEAFLKKEKLSVKD